MNKSFEDHSNSDYNIDCARTLRTMASKNPSDLDMPKPSLDDEHDIEYNGNVRIQPLLWSEKAKDVPFQAQQVLTTWIFIVAGITLFLDFAALQTMLSCLKVECTVATQYFSNLGNWFGTVSCIGWLSGFVILQHWLSRISATKVGQFACAVKILAAVFFNLQPMTGIANTRQHAGLAWSNLTGICLFHIGNLLSCFDFYVYPPPGSNKQGSWFEHGNLPITGMWIFQLATWLLVVANVVTCDWSNSPPGPLSTQWVDTDSILVMSCQYAGALLLLLGAVLYGVWCNAFRSLAL
jgi:hypothetical protein